MFIVLPVNAEEERWYDGFFIEGSALYYFAPGFLSELVKPKIGFRGVFGYELKRFRFAVESGFSRVTGTNPLVKEISFIPLVFKFGYALPIYSVLGFQADIGLGAAFSKTTRYETAVDMVTDNLREDSERSFFTGVRAYLTVSPLKYLKIYIGGGSDLILENDGPIPLPAIEAGVSFKPFAIRRKTPSKRRSAHVHETVICGVRFHANSAQVIEESINVIDEIGRTLQENPFLRVTLIAYHAAGGSEMQVRHGTGEPAISQARLNWCEGYLANNYGIDSSRISTEHRGAGNQRELFRCVEFIIK